MPAMPTATPTHVTSGGRSPVTARSSTTHNGMTATMSAATPLGTCFSASASAPMPTPSSSSPDHDGTPQLGPGTDRARRPRRSRR